MALYAHTTEAGSIDDWELLEAHVADVAETAARFASEFHGQDYARMAALLHDLGKAKPAFQAYLQGGKQEPHSAEGAVYAKAVYGKFIGQILAFCIAGHHAGLANGFETPKAGAKPATPLPKRLENIDCLDLPPNYPAIYEKVTDFAQPPFLAKASVEAVNFTLPFFIRMIFSCLVDADFLETERFIRDSEGKPILRGWPGKLQDLQQKLQAHMGQFPVTDAPLSQLRHKILTHARLAAAWEPGFFSLTVPTGGGKTLSSLSFALDHALKYDKKRVIYVIPFTSIIEQNADVFRQALKDEDAVLEHHSAFDWDQKGGFSQEEEGREGIEKLRLASQNWDRPVVATTAVQFFESLFANRTSRCRKLHHLANAVIILDEAQSMPLKFLRPCLAALQELVSHYGASIVLCTATQPALSDADGFPGKEALKKSEIREIAPDPEQLYQQLKRVHAHYIGDLSNQALADQMLDQPQALCIVNNRRQAQEIFELLGSGSGHYHLSTTMYGDHRRQKLQQMRDALKEGKEVRLVATSLIEAGVDIDFPVVYRAMAGIDSLAQAAGRCNREGQLAGSGGAFYIFNPDAVFAPPPELKINAEIGARIVADYPDDPLCLEAIHGYFRALYLSREAHMDSAEIGQAAYPGILTALAENATKLTYPFADIAAEMRLIDSPMVPILIVQTSETDPGFGAPYDLVRRLEVEPFLGKKIRELQKFSVQIPATIRDRLIQQGEADYIAEDKYGSQFVKLMNQTLYKEDLGLVWDAETENLHL